ncbi:hypothetical protein [Spartinivicinus marinus]|nr:hypothetical protein [Spartinivicinus marinus]MCX4026990.1 hypothetical protein [Spartinivicinus marinus]
MINDRQDLQPWKPRARVFKHHPKDADEIDIAIAEFVLDQSAGIANQIIINMMVDDGFNIELLNSKTQKLVKQIYKFIDYFETGKGEPPAYIRISEKQYQCLKAGFNASNQSLPGQFKGVPYLIHIEVR